MNPQDLSGFIANLLRSGPEIIGAFFTGVVLTVMVVYAFSGRIFSRGESDKELAKKDTEIARKDAEIARMDSQIVRVESKLARLDGKLLEKVDLFTSLPLEPMESMTFTSAAERKPPESKLSSPADSAKAQVRCSQLEAENLVLIQDKQFLEQTIKDLRTELAQVSGELEHSAKWLKRFDEENAHLIESQSLAKD